MISSGLSNRLIFVLSLLGLFVSSFLLYEYNLQGPVACPTGAGCDIVRASQYSSFLGISIPILGVLFYLVMAAFSVVQAQKASNNLLFQAGVLISLIGVGFGTYLTFLEIFVIKAICLYCMISAGISTALFLSGLYYLIASRKPSDKMV